MTSFVFSNNLVLDIDECLVKVFDNGFEVYEEIMSNPSLFHVKRRVFMITVLGRNMWGIKRPHLDEFLRYVNNKYNTVSIWTAGKREYAEAVVPEIFNDHKLPLIVMSGDDICQDNVSYWKSLDRFYVKCGQSCCNPINTMLMDNRKENFKKDIYNGLHIPDYDPDPEDVITYEDDCLLSVIDFMDKNIFSKTPLDIRTVNKELLY